MFQREILQFFWSIGFNLLPVNKEKRPVGEWMQWQAVRQTAAHMERLPWHSADGLAAICGEVSGGLVCFDLDKQADDSLLLELAGGLGLDEDYEWLVSTGSRRGYHLWVLTENLDLGDVGHIQRPSRLGGNLDLRYNDHYALLPPSNHHSGNTYEFINRFPANPPAFISAEVLLDVFDDLTIPKEKPKAFPAVKPTSEISQGNGNGWTDDYENVYINRALEMASQEVSSQMEGDRNETLYYQTLRLGGFVHKGLDPAKIENQMLAAAVQAGLPEIEAQRTIASALKIAQPREIPARKTERLYAGNGNGHSPATNESQALLGDTTRRNLTDYGNAERLVDRFGDLMRYCRALKAWITWHKTRWETDDTGRIVRFAKKVVREIPKELDQARTDAQRDAIKAWSLKSESAGKLAAMISLAETEPGIAVLPDEFDADPMLLNAQNCIIDLRTGEASPHDRQQLLMKQANAEYQPDAKCPTWLAFLDQIMDGNENLIDFIQKAIGYSLTGQTGEQVMFILYGGGSNGKSTLLELLRHLFADYSLNTPTSTIMRRADSTSTTNNDVARLRGARLVTAVETEENQQLAESTIKQITGGDTITARFLFGEFFEFKPTFKLWLAANHKPQIAGGDHGIWRRIRLIPFTVKITDDMKDIHLPEKLKAEAAGILSWAVEGCLRWQAEGLGIPDEVRAAVEAYQAEMDVLAAFIDDTCVQMSTAVVTAEALYKAYQKWTADNGVTALSQRKFGSKLKDRGYESHRGTAGRHNWRGLGLRDDEK